MLPPPAPLHSLLSLSPTQKRGLIAYQAVLIESSEDVACVVAQNESDFHRRGREFSFFLLLFPRRNAPRPETSDDSLLFSLFALALPEGRGTGCSSAGKGEEIFEFSLPRGEEEEARARERQGARVRVREPKQKLFFENAVFENDLLTFAFHLFKEVKGSGLPLALSLSLSLSFGPHLASSSFSLSLRSLSLARALNPPIIEFRNL